MKSRLALFIAAVFVLYFGGFVYDEVSPLLYTVVLAILASTPLLLKYSFWKKILLMVPLLVLRVLGKILIGLFGKNALSRLLARYGLLEERFNRSVEALLQTRTNALERWHGMGRSSQAYLLLIFMPVAIMLFLVSIIIKFVRLKFLQFIVEKIMQRFVVKWTVDKKKPANSKTADDLELGQADQHRNNAALVPNTKATDSDKG